MECLFVINHLFLKKFGMKFSENYKICGDYDFVIKWIFKRFTLSLKIKTLNNLHTIFDINGISSKKRFERDLKVILLFYLAIMEFKKYYLFNKQNQKYLEIIIY